MCYILETRDREIGLKKNYIAFITYLEYKKLMQINTYMLHILE